MEKAKPEKANVTLIKTIDGYESIIVNEVNYNDDKKIMVLHAIMGEVHNHDINDEEDMRRILSELDYYDYRCFNDSDINLQVERIEPFTEKELDKDMFLTIKYPSI